MYSYTSLSSISTLLPNSIVKSVHRAVVIRFKVIGLLVCVLRMQKGVWRHALPKKIWEFRSSETTSETIFELKQWPDDRRLHQHDYILNCSFSLSMAVG